MLRVLFADDHALVRDGTRPFLEMLDDEVDVREAEDVESALKSFGAELPPDIVILDLHMPGMNDLDGVRKIAAAYPDAKIVVVSGYYDQTIIDGVIAAGARGFIPKTSTGKSLLSALRIVLEGEVYVPHGLLDGAINPLPRQPRSFESSGSNPLTQLSERELEILRLLIDGMTNKQIARKLDLHEITVKGHLRNVYRKLGATNRADAVRISLQFGLE
ncbi:MAG: response regulator transcription factor [Rhodobacteraceae bacterium]|nr:response regulator transcription factor [Paracoccaceae bacterium]